VDDVKFSHNGLYDALSWNSTGPTPTRTRLDVSATFLSRMIIRLPKFNHHLNLFIKTVDQNPATANCTNRTNKAQCSHLQ